tara:strand:- start:1010 stop:1522 length:513 start_codon:yes stop_codon:yes gene_type:complete
MTAPVFKKFIDPAKLKEQVAFSDVDIDTAMMQQASLYSYYGNIYAQAQHQADRFKTHMTHVRARVAHAVREDAAEGGKKVTENMVEERIILHPDYIQAAKLANDSRMIAEMARNALEAFKQRRDMLVQVGKRQLEEMKGQARVTVSGTTGSGGSARDEATRIAGQVGREH